MKPILFSGPLVRCLLNTEVCSWPARAIDGSKPFKHQTRRPVSFQKHPFFFNANVPDWQKEESIDLAPHKVGDVLYVRETLRESNSLAVYDADGSPVMFEGKQWYWRWNKKVVPSIHMPRELSSIHLEVMRVRVERACDISEEDALAEGVKIGGMTRYQGEAKVAFHALWLTCYGPDSWNKWVWCFDLKRIK